MTNIDLFAGIVGQDEAVAQLRAALARPVHAYLLVGPPGLHQQRLVRAFAAGLLCPQGGCGVCNVCRRVLHGLHPDVVEYERQGPALTVEDARDIVRLAQRRPLEGMRQVIVVPDLHVARVSAPALLKTLEDPARGTVFVLLSDLVTEDLATIASRAVRIDLTPMAAHRLAAWLEENGETPERARELATSARGSPERAEMLAGDAHLAARHELWHSVPARLDGTGNAAAEIAVTLLESAEQATEPLKARHEQELAALAERAQAAGERGSGRKTIEDRQRREIRRWRTDELRTGLGVLAGAYRDRMSTAGGDEHGAAQRIASLAGAVTAVEDAARELVRNPNELLMLEALLVRLSTVGA
ncbi:MAG: hypothetical protein ACYDD4_03780 [Acidimicrobiales bacterium]